MEKNAITNPVNATADPVKAAMCIFFNLGTLMFFLYRIVLLKNPHEDSSKLEENMKHYSVTMLHFFNGQDRTCNFCAKLIFYQPSVKKDAYVQLW